MDLYCFPGAAAGASSFRTWPAIAAGRVDVVSMQMPGREGRLGEPACTSIEAAVDGVGGGLRAAVGDRPYGLFGHSMGAYHAFECARRLLEAGARPPDVLVMAGARAPGWDAGADPDDTDEALCDHLRRLGGTPQEVLDEPELMDLLLPTLRADLGAVRSYMPAPGRLDVRSVVLAGGEDPLAPPSSMAGWLPWFQAEPALVPRLGDHFFTTRRTTIEAVVRLCCGAPSHGLTKPPTASSPSHHLKESSDVLD